jgi:hypothetical protein
MGLPRRSAAARVGRWVDRALPLLPVRVGGKLVALTVEAAAQAGRRQGTSDQDAYRDQKAVEIERERRDEGNA